MQYRSKARILLLLLPIILFTLTTLGCGSLATEEEFPQGTARDRANPLFGQSIFGEGGLQLYGEDSIWSSNDCV